jgi:hypothetical protein
MCGLNTESRDRDYSTSLQRKGKAQQGSLCPARDGAGIQLGYLQWI